MSNALRANPQDLREQYEKQLKDLQEAYGEAMLGLRARRKVAAPAGRGREVTEMIRQGLQDEGYAVWISHAAGSVPRCTVYYKLRAPAHDGHDSGTMADSIPVAWRTVLRRHAGQFGPLSGMVSGMPGTLSA